MAIATQADPEPNLPRNGIKPGQWPGAPHNAMPPDCPVKVIGQDAEGVIWCRNATGDLRAIGKWDMAMIANLFAPCINYAFWAWPALGIVKKTDAATGEVTETLVVKRVERDKLFTCLANEASKKPLFDPNKQHRGRGGWTTSSNDFLWHSGKHLWKSTGTTLHHVPPQDVDGFLYTRQPLTIEPWSGAIAPEESPAQRILEDLRTWNFERSYLDPLLVMGFIVTSMMGGALKARPIIFTVGGAGVGKSTLHELMKHVLDGVIYSFVDTTAAGIYQKMKHDALPVMVDELENKPGSAKAQSVIDLARVAYTGGEIGRGGQDHEGVTFKMHSSFFFSAINPPPMTVADRTRMAILSLSRLSTEKGVGRKVVVKSETDGRMILRQIMDGWKTFSDVLQPKWWNILAGQGLDSRAIDTYGTLLAAAELVLGEQAMEDCGLPVRDADMLGAIIGAATAPDRAEHLDNWHKCVNRLFASSIDNWREGAKPSVGGVMQELATANIHLDDARKRLELVNLSARGKGDLGDPGCGPYLAIPPDGPQLLKLFAGSDWERGGWNIALKQGIKPGIVVSSREKGMMRISGSPQRCLLIDFSAFQTYAEKQ